MLHRAPPSGAGDLVRRGQVVVSTVAGVRGVCAAIPVIKILR